MILNDIRNAALSVIKDKVTLTISSTWAPLGQAEFNPGETVLFQVNIRNAADGAQLKKVRVHLRVPMGSGLALIVPPPAIATAYIGPQGPNTYGEGTERDSFYLETPTLATLAPGEMLIITNLKVKAYVPGPKQVIATLHGVIDMDWLIPANYPFGLTGADCTSSFNVIT